MAGIPRIIQINKGFSSSLLVVFSPLTLIDELVMKLLEEDELEVEELLEILELMTLDEATLLL